MESMQITYCSKCGNQLSENADFCNQCGKAPNNSSSKEIGIPKWEYMVESVSMNERWSNKMQDKEISNLEKMLDSYGNEGWEMLSYESIPMYGTFSKNLKGHAYLVFFKRPKR